MVRDGPMSEVRRRENDPSLKSILILYSLHALVFFFPGVFWGDGAERGGIRRYECFQGRRGQRLVNEMSISEIGSSDGIRGWSKRGQEKNREEPHAVHSSYRSLPPPPPSHPPSDCLSLVILSKSNRHMVVWALWITLFFGV